MMIEIFKELIEKASNNAFKAIELMIGKKTYFSVKYEGLMNIRDIVSFMNPSNERTTILFSNIKGLKASIILVFDLKHLLRLADIFLKKPLGYYKDLSDENLSTLKEICNIIIGYYMDLFRKFKYVDFEIPELSINPYKVLEFLNIGKIYIEDVKCDVFVTSFLIERFVYGKIIFVFREGEIYSISKFLVKKGFLKLNI